MKTVKIPILEEFREFALRGNVADLAVGVIIGAAFGKIVTALVSDVIMPPIGRLVGNLDFTNLYLPLSEKVRQAQELYAAAPATPARICRWTWRKKPGRCSRGAISPPSP